eukprot:scaffold134379_cov33-Attheya_sp.AAC.1
MVSGDNNKEYTVTAHMKWVDQDNLGVSHFGIHPENLRQENICFDIFHLRSSITRRLMIYWQKVHDATNRRDHEVWNLNKAFTSFKGVDIKAFLSNIPNVINFIKTTFTTSEFLENVCEGLSLWSSISKFMHIVEIPDEDAYLIKLSQFETNLSSFYAYVGGRYFYPRMGMAMINSSTHIA